MIIRFGTLNMPSAYHALRISLGAVFFLLCSQALWAASANQNTEMDKLQNVLQERLGDNVVDAIAPSPVPGLYEIMIGPRIFYVSADGRYLLNGSLKDMTTGKDLTEEKMAVARRRAVDAVGENNMLVFGNGDEKYTVDVFTDVDCGYCRKLHSQIEDYNKEGIRIRYMFYPRAGLNSSSAEKAVSVWCSDDRKQAMTLAKQGQQIPRKVCENPVSEHYHLGQLVGVRGTPALVLEDGRLLSGYLPPKKLRRRLDALAATAR